MQEAATRAPRTYTSATSAEKALGLRQALIADTAAMGDDMQADFDDTESEDDAIEVVVNFVDDSQSRVHDFVGDVDGLKPPAEAAAAHDEAVAMGRQLVDMYDNAITVLDSDTIETFKDATLVLEDPGCSASFARYRASCFALADLAAENGITVDLGCK